MARRKSTPKIQPAVYTLKFNIVNVESTTHDYIDLSQCASIVNRRFYRQGLNWAVDGFTLITPADVTGGIEVQSLQCTWVQYNAWKKAYLAWKAQEDDTMRDANATSTIARFRDFKIYFDPAHSTAGFGANLIPHDSGAHPGAPYDVGDNWDVTQIVIPNEGGVAGNTVEFTLHMHGNDLAAGAGNSFGLIENYQNSRATPQSPAPSVQVPQNTFFNEMHDVGEESDDIIVNAINKNDELPYAQDNYPGGEFNAPTGQFVSGLETSPTNVRRYLSFRGGMFPAGLIKLTHDLSQQSSGDGSQLLVHLVPGDHRGYLAVDMKGM